MKTVITICVMLAAVLCNSGCRPTVTAIFKKNIQLVGPMKDGEPVYYGMTIGNEQDPYFSNPFELLIRMPDGRWQSLGELSIEEIMNQEDAFIHYEGRKTRIQDVPRDFIKSVFPSGKNEAVGTPNELRPGSPTLLVYLYPYSFLVSSRGILSVGAQRMGGAMDMFVAEIRRPGSPRTWVFPMSEADALELIGGDPDRIWRSWAK